jgi:hypothetical protein
MRTGARLAAASTTALVALAAGRAHAGAWSAAGDASLTTSYDSNVRFTRDNRTVDGIAALDGDLRLDWLGDASQLSLLPRARTIGYRETHAYNRTEGYLTVTGRKSTERSKVDLRIDGSLDTTITSELGFTGYSDTNKRRRGLNVSLAPQYRLTERMALTGSVGLNFNRYVDARFTPLVDYDYKSASIGLQRTISERSTLALQASAGRMRVPGRSQYDKDNYQVVLDYNHQFGPRWSTELAAGPSRVRSPVFHRSDSGFVYTASLEREGERNTVDLSATRTVSPNGLGALARRDVVSMHLLRHATERMTLGASANWSRVLNSSLDGGFGNYRLNYLDVGIDARWKPARTWTLSLGVDRYLQSYGTPTVNAGKTVAQLGFSWAGLGSSGP